MNSGLLILVGVLITLLLLVCGAFVLLCFACRHAVQEKDKRITELEGHLWDSVLPKKKDEKLLYNFKVETTRGTPLGATRRTSPDEWPDSIGGDI